MAALSILKGIKVVSFTQHLLGPAGTQLLADMGADVIKVEAPKGAAERNHAGCEAFIGGVSLYQVSTGRNYRSVAFNLKDPDAKKAAFELVSAADVVIENFRPGVMDRLGLGYDTVKAVNPKVVYVSCTGYGRDDSVKDLPGQDLVMQAVTGLADATGSLDGPPVAAGSAIVDVHGGTLLALGVVSALFERVTTGVGQRIDITMVQAALDLQLEPITYSMNGFPVRRSGKGLSNGYSEAPYGIYKTKDSYIVLSVSPMATYYEALKDDRLLPYLNERSVWDDRQGVHDTLQEIMLDKTTDEWVDIMRPFGIWMQRINTQTECFDHPAVKAANTTMKVTHPDAGELTVLKPPINFGSGEVEVRYIAPRLGEHNAEVLKELGYDDAKIKEMEDKGAIAYRKDTEFKGVNY